LFTAKVGQLRKLEKMYLLGAIHKKQLIVGKIDIISCFTYWLVFLNERPLYNLNFQIAIIALNDYLNTTLKSENAYFNLFELQELLSAKKLRAIREIAVWEKPFEDEYIDLDTLRSNMVYMILRLEITGQFE
jgi:hypothetical protein